MTNALMSALQWAQLRYLILTVPTDTKREMAVFCVRYVLVLGFGKCSRIFPVFWYDNHFVSKFDLFIRSKFIYYLFRLVLLLLRKFGIVTYLFRSDDYYGL